MSGVWGYVVALQRTFVWVISSQTRRAMAGSARRSDEKSTFLWRSRLGAGQQGGGVGGWEVRELGGWVADMGDLGRVDRRALVGRWTMLVL